MHARRFEPRFITPAYLASASLAAFFGACADEPHVVSDATSTASDAVTTTEATDESDVSVAVDSEVPDIELPDTLAADTLEATPEVVDPCAGRVCGEFSGQACGQCSDEKVCSAAGACLGWRAIASNGGDICGVLEDGTLACRETWNPHRLPAGADFAEVAVGRDFVCALTSGGEIRCAGKDPGDDWGGGPTDFGPTGNTWVQVSAGDAHYCGRDASSHVTCWGIEAWDEVSGVPTTGIFVDAGHERTCVIAANHLATCVGRPSDGDLYVPAATWGTIMAANFRHACGTLNVGGAVVCWGNSAGSSDPSGSFVQVVAKNSDGATCGLTSNGDMVCWNTGFGDHSYAGDFSAIAIDQNEVCGLAGDGGLTCDSIDGF